MRGLRLHEARRARGLRRDQTEAERRDWWRLRNRTLGGFKLVRQEPIGPYFADLVCREENLSSRSTVGPIRPGMNVIAMARVNSSCTIRATGWLASATTKSIETSTGSSTRSWGRWGAGGRCSQLAANLLGPSPRPSPRLRGEREFAGLPQSASPCPPRRRACRGRPYLSARRGLLK
jgi:hypothetical protein